MKVFEVRDSFGLDHLTPGERPRLEPGPGQVLVKMKPRYARPIDTLVLGQGFQHVQL